MLSEPGVITEASTIQRLWVHEVMRVYYDRLVDDSDHAWLVKFLKETVQVEFGTKFDELFKQLDSNNDGMYTHTHQLRANSLGEKEVKASC